MPSPEAPPECPGWYVLIHQLPPRPLYLRAKVRRRLARVGAVAVKNSVYVLPARADCLEDFQWIAQEAVAGGGDACVCRAEFVDGLSAEALIERFRGDVSAKYGRVRTGLNRLLAEARKSRGPSPHAGARLAQLRKQVHEIGRTDFFASTTGREVQALMAAIEQTRRRAEGARPERKSAPASGELVGRVWVTRVDPHVDRLATAWLIRRFVDPAARFRFVDPAGGRVRPGELSFDMVGATFGHDADRCTFETVVARLGLTDPALGPIGEIVHDIDLKDGRFGRPETHGVQQLIQGLVEAHPDSAARLAAGHTLFDTLHASFGGRQPPARAKEPRRRTARRKR
ncbi:MAG TPA: chromate resistance protein ChrB domain-containing protein [Vicinamibacterales bacterium]|nr:chromate resistance protein ChrB domain-containing protein [Vicinamibacterales bacterium]